MQSKWIINLEGFDKYVFGEDKKLYRLPVTKGKRSYGIREIKKAKDRNRYRLNGQWWSERQLNPHIELDPNPRVLFNENTPF